MAFFKRMADDKYTPANKELKTKFISFKLSRVAGKLSGYLQKQTKAIKQAVDQANELMQRHESLMADYSKNYEKILRERNEAARNRLEAQVEESLTNEVDYFSKHLAEENWKKAHDLAKDRIHQSCSICLNDLQNGKPLMMTNCGHLFHASCLTSFENFTLKKELNCPNCRQAYSRIPFLKETT